MRRDFHNQPFFVDNAAFFLLRRQKFLAPRGFIHIIHKVIHNSLKMSTIAPQLFWLVRGSVPLFFVDLFLNRTAAVLRGAGRCLPNIGAANISTFRTAAAQRRQPKRKKPRSLSGG